MDVVGLYDWSVGFGGCYECEVYVGKIEEVYLCCCCFGVVLVFYMFFVFIGICMCIVVLDLC